MAKKEKKEGKKFKPFDIGGFMKNPAGMMKKAVVKFGPKFQLSLSDFIQKMRDEHLKEGEVDIWPIFKESSPGNWEVIVATVNKDGIIMRAIMREPLTVVAEKLMDRMGNFSMSDIKEGLNDDES